VSELQLGSGCYALSGFGVRLFCCIIHVGLLMWIYLHSYGKRDAKDI
jgi:hypothetical protein